MDFHGGAAFPATIGADISFVTDGKTTASVALRAGYVYQHTVTPWPDDELSLNGISLTGSEQITRQNFAGEGRYFGKNTSGDLGRRPPAWMT